ncbi:MAG: DUF99 family protein [Candidatus Methanomethylicia archaeon]|jgi:endonuclease V-like protein UPF0215 family|nr:DUF99 family protein [Candidatus Methanomethylicia archaeon]
MNIGIGCCGFRKRIDRFVPLVIMITKGILPLELIIKNIEVDGLDATDKIIEVLSEKKIEKGIIMARSIPIAGFNIINANRIFNEIHLPTIFILERKPNMNAVRQALKKHFSDWEKRLAILESIKIEEVETLKGTFILGSVGIDINEAKKIIEITTIFGKIPEPLRLARIIAKSLTNIIRNSM